MIKQRAIFIIGLWVLLLPFLGFPIIWKKILFAGTGILLMGLAYLLYREKEDLLIRIFGGEREKNPAEMLGIDLKDSLQRIKRKKTAPPQTVDPSLDAQPEKIIEITERE